MNKFYNGRGEGGSLYRDEQWPGGVGAGSLYGEAQCIMGNGHIAHSCRQTDTTENITFATPLISKH